MAESWTSDTLRLFSFPLPSPPHEDESYDSPYPKSDVTIDEELQPRPTFTSQYTLTTSAPSTYAQTVPSPTHSGDLTTATFMSHSPTHQQPPSASAPSPHPMRQSAFPWPIPHTTITTPTATNPPMNLLSSGSSTSTPQLPSFGDRSFVDITVREILEEYKNDAELLKSIFMAKIEEDKRRTAEEITKAEQARIQLKQLEYDLLKEQSKPGGRYAYPYGSQPMPPNGPGSAYIVVSPHEHHSATPASPITGPTPYTYMVPMMSPTVLTPTDYAPSVHTPHSYAPYAGQSYGPPSATLPSPSPSRSFQYSALTTAPQNLHISSPIPHPASPYGHPAQSPMSPIAPDYHHHHHHPTHPHISPSSSMSTSTNLPSPGVPGPNSAATRKRSRSSTNFGSDGMTSRHTDLASPSSASHRDSSPTDANGKQLSHDQIMEALKAKLAAKNSSSSANGNTNASTTSSSSTSKATRGSSSPRASGATRPTHRRSTSSTSNRSQDDNTHIKKSSSPSTGSASPSPVPRKRFITPIDLKVVNSHRHNDEILESSTSTLPSAYTMPSASTPASSIGGHGSPLHLGATGTKRSASPSPRLAAAIIGSGSCE